MKAKTSMNLENTMPSEGPVTKDHILYSISMKCSEQTNIQRQKADHQVPGAGGSGVEWRVTTNEHRVPLGIMNLF